jgi:hypothetical protein
MKWIGRVFLFLLVALAGFLTVSAGVTYVASQMWRGAALADQTKRLDARFNAAITTRIEASAFDDDDCIWFGDAHAVAANLHLLSSVSRIALALGEREACGEVVDEDELRRRRRMEDDPWGFGHVPGPVQFAYDVFGVAARLVTADRAGTLRYQYAQRQAGIMGYGALMSDLPYQELEARIDGFLDGTLTAHRIIAAVARRAGDDAETRRRLAVEHAYHPNEGIQMQAWSDLYWSASRFNGEAIWQLTLLARGQWPEGTGGVQPFESLDPEEYNSYVGDVSEWLRFAVAHGHEEATRAFLDNGWNRQGEDGNGDGIVWSDRFATPYWWAVHAVRLGDPAYEAELDAAMAHLEAQGCADHARAVGTAWRGVLADFWSDHTPVRDLILERVDCAAAAYDAPEWHSTRRSRSDEPLLGLREINIATDLTL